MKEIFTGPDGAISGRRLIGTVLIIFGCVLLLVGQLQASGDWIIRLAPAGVALTFGALFWGLVTVQNITDAAKAVKGQG